MKPARKRKLALHRDTLRVLGDKEIASVVGARPFPTITAIETACSVGTYSCTCFCA
jgi:hypothetical protein